MIFKNFPHENKLTHFANHKVIQLPLYVISVNYELDIK